MAAPVAAPPATDPVVGEAISVVLGTPFMETLKSGASYRELNESLMSYCPTLDVRKRTQVIDRLKAMAALPENASLRVGFGRTDHKLLSEAAQFGSITAGLSDRTSGGRQTLASAVELQEAIKALRQRGSSMHVHLAETLERGMVQASLTEGRAEASAWGKPFAGQSKPGSFKLNVAKISVKQAISHAESIYDRFGMDLAADLPDLEKNFKLLKAKMKYAKPISRLHMPVLEPKDDDLKAIKKDLEAGRLDIFAPWAPEHLPNLFPWEHKGNPKMKVGDKKWITLGVQDGDPSDDKLPVGEKKPQAVQTLKPLQAEIWYDKLIASIIAFGPPKAGSFITTAGVAVISSDNYIIDGHHRFGQIYLSDPSLPMQVLLIDLPQKKLLDLARSYGTARGHRSKA